MCATLQMCMVLNQGAKLLAFQDTQKHCRKAIYYKEFRLESP